MDAQIFIASLLSFIFVFFTVLFVAVMLHRQKMRQLRNHIPEEEWLFHKWSEILYDQLVKKDTIAFGRKIGVDVPTYLHNCDIAGITPNAKDILMKKLLGYILLAVSGVLGLITANVYILLVGMTIAITLIFFPMLQADNAAKRKKFQITEELPRFIDLFSTALIINLPVEDAILTTAKSLPDSLIAREFLKAIAETKLGVYDWQAALENMSRRYEVDVLSDFSLDLINSYKKGVPIADAVARKSKDIKQANLLTMKERATKLTSTILLPVLGFKVLPLLALLCIPIIQQIVNGL